MADGTIYTRVYSSTSAGALVSGKGRGNGPLPEDRLLHEFRNHWNLNSEEPTALVSVSSRIIDTVLRAFQKHLNDNEPAEDIWIIFIEVPRANDGVHDQCHHAEPLARDCGHEEPRRFHYEYVFEHAIPEECVLHKVSLEILMARWLDRKKYFVRTLKGHIVRRALPASTQRERISKVLWRIQGHSSPWEVGVELGLFARAFGARAPTHWIANQLYCDCVTETPTDHNNWRVKYACGDYKILRKENACFRQKLMGDGIDHALIYWWLADLWTSEEYLEFDWWRGIMEDAMTFDQHGFRQTQESIEAAAVRLGL